MAYVPDEYTGRHLGKYEVLCRIAVGGMAEIFLGFARSGPCPNEMVVLKRILAEQRGEQDALQLLIDEAKVCATLDHPNVGRVLDLERADDEVLLVMEFIRGATLEELSTFHLQRGELLPVGFVLTAICDAAQGLHHAHTYLDTTGKLSPIIHRDVTPRNLMVGFDGSGRVLDFGIARRLGAARRTVAGMVRGTSAYMAPEQAVDKKMDTRSDLFSLGIVLHELLTGKRLFYKGNPALEMAAVYEGPILAPSAVHKRVPAALDAVVLKALTRNVAQRYQTALDLVADVEKVAGESMWSQPRSAALVADKFANRQVEIQALGSRVGGTDLLVQPTTPGWPVFKTLDAPLPFTVSRPSSSSNPDARETPMLGDGVDTPTDSVSSSRLSESDLWQPAGRAATPRGAQPQGANLSSTEESDLASTPKRRWALALGALAAIAAGAVTGLLVYRVSVSSAGVSITAPRPIEVAFKGKSLGLTPLRDVTLPAGMQQLEVREGDGPWRPLEIEVAAQTATRVDVVLDAAP